MERMQTTENTRTRWYNSNLLCFLGKKRLDLLLQLLFFLIIKFGQKSIFPRSQVNILVILPLPKAAKVYSTNAIWNIKLQFGETTVKVRSKLRSRSAEISRSFVSRRRKRTNYYECD